MADLTRKPGWLSPGFRSAKTRARWAVLLLATSGVLGALAVVAAIGFYAQVGAYEAGTISSDALVQSGNTLDGITAWGPILYVATSIAFLAWLSRSVENAPPLWAGTPSTSPRGALGWWFVPVASFFKPYQIVRDLYDRLALPETPRTATVVIVWWVTFVLGSIANRVPQYMMSSLNPTTQSQSELLSGLRGIAVVTIAAQLLWVAAAACGFLVVREIQNRANLRATRLGISAPEAVWPTAMTPPSPTAGSPMVAVNSEPRAQSATPGPIANAETGESNMAISQSLTAPAVAVSSSEPPAMTAPIATSPVDAMAMLAQMRDRGLITAAEYERKKAELLARF